MAVGGSRVKDGPPSQVSRDRRALLSVFQAHQEFLSPPVAKLASGLDPPTEEHSGMGKARECCVQNRQPEPSRASTRVRVRLYQTATATSPVTRKGSCAHSSMPFMATSLSEEISKRSPAAESSQRRVGKLRPTSPS